MTNVQLLHEKDNSIPLHNDVKFLCYLLGKVLLHQGGDRPYFNRMEKIRLKANL
jgi:hypothetical protein